MLQLPSSVVEKLDHLRQRVDQILDLASRYKQANDGAYYTTDAFLGRDPPKLKNVQLCL